MDTVRAALRKKWLMTSLLKAGDYSSTLGRFVAEDERQDRHDSVAGIRSPFKPVQAKWAIGSRQGKTVTRWPLTVVLSECHGRSGLPLSSGKFSSSAFL